MGMDFHVRQILKKELDIISGRKVVCLCCFYNAVDHCAGFCAGRRVAEQPVLSADSTVVQQRLRSRDRFCCQSACLLAARAVVGILPLALWNPSVILLYIFCITFLFHSK